jgi:hypothetical protein
LKKAEIGSEIPSRQVIDVVDLSRASFAILVGKRGLVSPDAYWQSEWHATLRAKCLSWDSRTSSGAASHLSCVTGKIKLPFYEIRVGIANG